MSTLLILSDEIEYLLRALVDFMAAGAPPGTRFRLYEDVCLSHFTGNLPNWAALGPCFPFVLCRDRDVLLAVSSDLSHLNEDGDDAFLILNESHKDALWQSGFPVLDGNELKDVPKRFHQNKKQSDAGAHFYNWLVEFGFQKQWEAHAWQYHPVVVPDSLLFVLKAKHLLREWNEITVDGLRMGLCSMRSLAGDPAPKEDGTPFICCASEKWEALWDVPKLDWDRDWDRTPLKERWDRLSREGQTFPGYFHRDIYELLDLNMKYYMNSPFLFRRLLLEDGGALVDWTAGAEAAFGDLNNCTYGQAIRQIEKQIAVFDTNSFAPWQSENIRWLITGLLYVTLFF